MGSGVVIFDMPHENGSSCVVRPRIRVDCDFSLSEFCAKLRGTIPREIFMHCHCNGEIPGVNTSIVGEGAGWMHSFFATNNTA